MPCVPPSRHRLTTVGAAGTNEEQMNRSYRDILFTCLVLGALYLPIVAALGAAAVAGAGVGWLVSRWLD